MRLTLDLAACSAIRTVGDNGLSTMIGVLGFTPQEGELLSHSRGFTFVGRTEHMRRMESLGEKKLYSEFGVTLLASPFIF